MSDFYKGYKIPIYPNESQKALINKYINLYRYVYNWALTKEEEQYAKKKAGLEKRGELSYYDLGILYTHHKKDNPWLEELPTGIARMALRDLVLAYKRFFKGYTRRPKYKSKKRSPKCICLRDDRFYFNDNMVRLDGSGRYNYIYSKYHTNKDIKHKGKYKNVSISIDNLGNYWLGFTLKKSNAIKFEYRKEKLSETNVIGIDLNVKETFVLSNGEVYRKPDTTKLDKRIKRLHRKHQKDIKRTKSKLEITNQVKYEDIPYSENAKKRLDKLRKAYKKKTNIIHTFCHTVTKDLCTRDNTFLVYETLEVKRIKQTSFGSLQNFPLGKIVKMLDYKCNMYGMPHMKAPVTYPSSQICSNCGSIRKKCGHTYICPNCGLHINRHLNAAINLSHLAQ